MTARSTPPPPVPPLPKPHLEEPLPGVTLLQPLSRRGTGPGLVLLLPDLNRPPLSIENGVPSPLVKWAEESYVVAAINTSALQDPGQAKRLIAAVVQILNDNATCDLKDRVGLVADCLSLKIAYSTAGWNMVAPLLKDVPSIRASVVYATVEQLDSLSTASVPTVQHFAGKASPISLHRGKDLMQYSYPEVESAQFSLPFQDAFHYNAESVSHTRNLTFLKNIVGGPYFDLEQIWDEHTYYEFENRSVEHTMSTMVQEPYVNHVPTLTGGIGREELTAFYRDHFIWKNPQSTTLELISRTMGIDRVVDEFIFKFRHDSEVDWLIPGIAPTYKDLEIPFMAVVNIRGDRLYHEHITWDQGTVLMQLGMMPTHLPVGEAQGVEAKATSKVPAFGRETAQKLRDKNSVGSNSLFANLLS
ncbi:hypothetical protein N7470_007812 [Penicillium chermesinum]|nr:hypothetical protein N7470_007812 [Penicillium chermesinum]